MSASLCHHSVQWNSGGKSLPGVARAFLCSGTIVPGFEKRTFMISAAMLLLIAMTAIRASQSPRERGQLNSILALEYEIPHGGRVTALAFSPDGRQLATSTGGQLIRIWDSSTGRELKKLNEAGEQLPGDLSIGLNAYALAYSPDGRILAAAGDVVSSDNIRVGTEIDLWDLSSGVKKTIPTSKTPKAKFSQAVIFAQNGKSVFVALMSYEPGDSPGQHVPMAEIREWDVPTGAFKRTWKKLDDFRLQSVALSPDGKTLAIGYFDRMAMIGFWDLETGGRLRDFQTFFGTHSLSYSPDGTKLVSCQDPRMAGGNALRGIVICDVKLGYLGTISTGQSPFVSATAFSPDGMHLATGDMGYPSAPGTGAVNKGSTVKMWRVQ